MARQTELFAPIIEEIDDDLELEKMKTNKALKSL